MTLEEHHLAVFHRHRRELAGFDLALRLSWMRKMAPGAFRHLCRTDTRCAAVAVTNGWSVAENEATVRSHTAEEIAAAEATVAEAIGAVRQAAPAWSPHHVRPIAMEARVS